MADEDDDHEDDHAAELRRLKSENDSLRRQVARLQGEVKARADETDRIKRAKLRPRFSKGATSAFDRPWDGR